MPTAKPLQQEAQSQPRWEDWCRAALVKVKLRNRQTTAAYVPSKAAATASLECPKHKSRLKSYDLNS